MSLEAARTPVQGLSLSSPDAEAGVLPVQPGSRTTCSSSDPLEAREFIGRAYGARLQVSSVRSGGWQIALDQYRSAQIALLDLDLPLDLSFRTQGQDEFAFVSRITGSGEVDPGQHCARYGPGDLFLAVTPETDRIHRTHHSHARSVNIRSIVFDELICKRSERRAGRWRFTSQTPIAGGKARWNRAVRVLADALNDPETGDRPLVLGPATRLLAATALSVFPNTAVAESRAIDHHDGHPAALRRAVEFIDAHPDLDISVPDIARAANVTSRAVQLAFRRHLDTTPLAYLREVRLRHAHLELLAATSADGQTVGRIAIDWGFASPSRFAAYYQAAYGHPPSQTLRS